jgi:GR25 family glycosyltransferase involved in LPS biosynthesis
MSFEKIITNMTKTGNIGYYIIHLDKAIERLPFIEKLQGQLNTNLNVFKAADGYELIKSGHPIICQQRGHPATRGAGDIGCSVSHINICKDAISKKYDYIVIFEDDCIFKTDLNTLNSSLEEFIKSNIQWDIFLLGSDILKSDNTGIRGISKIYDFNCTHACILKSTFINELIKTYDEYYTNNVTLSIDTTYSNILKSGYLSAYGFNDSRYFSQQSGLFSYVIERIR